MAYADPATLAELGSGADALRAQLYNQKFLNHADTQDVLSALEGPDGSNAVIAAKRDLIAAQGEKINFGGLEELGEIGKVGDDEVEGYEEDPLMTANSVTIDFQRHATGYTRKAMKVLAAGKELKDAASGLLGRHYGRRKQDRALIRLIREATTDNTYFANGKATIDALVSADVLSSDVIVEAGAHNQTLGSEAVGIYKRNKNGYSVIDQLNYMFLSDHNDLTQLQQLNTYLTAVAQADQRGTLNQLFMGGFKDIQGNAIVPFRGVQSAKIGKIGSALAPIGIIGEAVATAGAAAVALKGNGRAGIVNTAFKPFSDFPGYDYPFYEGQTAYTDSGTHYALIIVRTGADAGKFGFVSYVGTANLGHQITTTARLGANSVTTLGSVATGSGPFSGLITDAYPVGSLIVPCNSAGVPYSVALSLGARSLCRAYGVDYEMTMEQRDHGHRYSLAYSAMFGENVMFDSLTRPENYVAAYQARNIPGVSLPTVS